MMEDPIVEEVRRIRGDFAAKFNYDLRAMCEFLRKETEAKGVKTVTLPPRRPVGHKDKKVG
jgi:hypothetical protein